MLKETLMDLSMECVVFTVRVPDGTGIVCGGLADARRPRLGGLAYHR